MSFDLAIWNQTKMISAEQAQQVYTDMCTEIHFPEPSRGVQQFVADLTEDYPQIDDWDEETLEDCPWSCEFDESPGHCIINIRWGMEEEILPIVIEKAHKYSLTCYDPQSEQLYFPE